MKEDLDVSSREDLFPFAKLTSTRGHYLKVNQGKPANLEYKSDGGSTAWPVANMLTLLYHGTSYIRTLLSVPQNVDSFKINYKNDMHGVIIIIINNTIQKHAR